MPVPPSGRKRCPSADDADTTRPASPQAGRVRADTVSAASRARPIPIPPPPGCASDLWQKFLDSDDEVFRMDAHVRRDVLLDISGFMRAVRVRLDHPDDGVRITALPRNMTLEFPVLPGDGIDARDIDFGRAPDALAERHAPLPSLSVAMVSASDGGVTFIINEPGGSHVLRVVIAGSAAPSVRQRLIVLLYHAQREQRRFQRYWRLMRSGLLSTCWIATFSPLSGQLWNALPITLRKTVCNYFVDTGTAVELTPEIDFSAALVTADPPRLALLLEMLSGALGYWLERARFDQMAATCRDQKIRHHLPCGPTATYFMASCQRALQDYRAASGGPVRQRGADMESARFAAVLADPAVNEITLSARHGEAILIAPLMRDITFKLVDADSMVEFAEFGCGWARLQTSEHTRSLAIGLRQVGYRLPRHLVPGLHQDAHAGTHASVTDMRRGGGMRLYAPPAVAFDATRWNQFKTAADFRLEMSLSNLLEWSEVLARGRRLTREQDMRLADHLQEMDPEADHWATGLANALIEEAGLAPVGCSVDCRQLIFLLQQLQVAQLKLYLSGGLLRRLAQDQWRNRIRQHGALASIVSRITAVHVDCAWEAMDAGGHYEALCRHLCALERSERDPVRQHVLCRDRELLEMVLQIMAGVSECRVPSHARELAACTADAQRKLVLKIILIGLLDTRLFSVSEQWRNTLLHRLRHVGERPRASLNMHDMALIAFLRHADAAQLAARLGT